MDTEARIKGILKEVPGVCVNQRGNLWLITILHGSHAGARENGVSLAEDMLTRWKRGEYGPVEIAHSDPVTVSGTDERGAAGDTPDKPPPPDTVMVENPETLARLKDAEKALAEALSKLAKSQDALPDELRDLVRENEPHAAALGRLRGVYTQLTNRLVDTRLPPLSDAERALQHRLQRALYSERKGAIEIS